MMLRSIQSQSTALSRQAPGAGTGRRSVVHGAHSAAPRHLRHCVAPRASPSDKQPAVSPFGPGAASSSPFAAAPGKAAAGATAAAAPTATSSSLQGPWSLHSWSWQGHKIQYATAGCGRPVVLVHGFGASLGHYRRTIPALAAAGYKVYAVDLLGFGASDKPILSEGYTIETWAQLVSNFVSEFAPPAAADSGSSSGSGGSSSGGEEARSGAVLVGNSIGSLICLAAAAELPSEAVAGVALLNSAGAMNNKGVVSDWRIILALPLFWLIDLLLSIRPIARNLFDSVREPETLAKVLGGVYRNTAAVDDELVTLIAAPSEHPNALDVFVSVITGPPGPKPWDLLPQIEAPIFIAWGDKDPFTPLDGPVGKFFAALPESRPDTTFALLEDVGHCPQDDRPERLHEQLLPWLQAVFAGERCSSAPAAAAAAGAASSTN